LAGLPAGGSPPVGGPLWAIASEVPPNSSAIIARLFTVRIFTSNIELAHLDVPTRTRCWRALFPVVKKQGHDPPEAFKLAKFTLRPAG
jgi:hypothetical protein